MADFVIDTVGDLENQEIKSSEHNNNSLIADLLKEFKETLINVKRESKVERKLKEEDILTKEILDDLKLTAKQQPKLKLRKGDTSDLVKSNKEVVEALRKSDVLKPDFEHRHTLAQHSDKKLKQLRRKEQERTKGKKWYGLPATELTEEVKRDLEIIQMRSVLDPKHFYKKNDLNVLPKYFQVGKVVDSPLDYYNNRLTKKERKKTLVDELLADAEFSKYNKRKYKEIIEEKQKTHYKEWRKAKRLKKRK